MDEMICPHCGKRMRYDFGAEKIMCKDCGYSPLDARSEAVKEQEPRQRVKLTHRGEINRSAMAAFNTGHEYLHKGDKTKALEAFERSVFLQRDFLDAHIALADLVDDNDQKREHLSVVLALDGTNPEALRRIMVLNGRLNAEDVARTYHHNDQQIARIDTVTAQGSESLLCPVCGGNLTVHDQSGQVECKFCGHVEVRFASRDVASDSLAMALIERKANPVRWVIGKRILHCNECGSERTIPASKLTDECPFCGSQHVVQQDAVESLEQPNGIVRFTISKQQAGEAIQSELKNIRNRIANLFDNNRIAGGVVQGVYLPFWMFDVFTQVTVTKTYTGSSRNGQFAAARMPTTETFTDALNNVPVCGVSTPTPSLTRKLGKFNLDTMVAYQPKLLAKYPAELYTIDFDKASLDAREDVSNIMREKHSQREIGDEQMQISVFSNIQNMNFRLLLLPVWVATLTEADGDTRAALVNGQTGKVVLGKAQKPR